MCHIIEHLFSLLDFAYTVELRGINHPIFAEEKVSFSTGLYCIFFHGLLGIHRLAERKKFPPEQGYNPSWNETSTEEKFTY